MAEALQKVRADLGEEAIILRTRKVKKGGLISFLSKDLVEVVASSPDRKLADRGNVEDKANRIRRGFEAHPSKEIIEDLHDELSDLKGHVRDLAEMVKIERMPSLPQQLAEFYKIMIRSGVEDSIVKEMTQHLNIMLSGDDLEDDKLIKDELLKSLHTRIRLRKIPVESNGKAKIFALIGPTGVGKTTTLAKLVTSYRYWGKSDTALVSADTYRVAALEQLKTFASIAGLPMEAVYQPAAMENALSRHAKREAIFIDTAGRSQADVEKLAELSEFLKAAKPDEILLCLAVSTRLEDQLDIVKRYEQLKPTGIVFTKLDETKGPGMILSVLNHTDLPLTYITCGQNVPDDIMTARKKPLSELILNPDILTDLQAARFETWINDDTDGSERNPIRDR